MQWQRSVLHCSAGGEPVCVIQIHINGVYSAPDRSTTCDDLKMYSQVYLSITSSDVCIMLWVPLFTWLSCLSPDNSADLNSILHILTLKLYKTPRVSLITLQGTGTLLWVVGHSIINFRTLLIVIVSNVGFFYPPSKQSTWVPSKVDNSYIMWWSWWWWESYLIDVNKMLGTEEYSHFLCHHTHTSERSAIIWFSYSQHLNYWGCCEYELHTNCILLPVVNLDNFALKDDGWKGHPPTPYFLRRW